MSFGKMLYTLRKGQNMSQEALADELNTSRQAVSKWKTGQGFPKMEKLLMISNLFGVTVDCLLKGEGDSTESGKEQGYDASRESIEGFLRFKRNVAKPAASGAFLILMSGTPYLLFPKFPVLYSAMAVVLIAAGIGFGVTACSTENNCKKITEEPLFIDNGYLTELRNRYNQLKKRYMAVLAAGIGQGLAGPA